MKKPMLYNVEIILLFDLFLTVDPDKDQVIGSNMLFGESLIVI